MQEEKTTYELDDLIEILHESFKNGAFVNLSKALLTLCLEIKKIRSEKI